MSQIGLQYLVSNYLSKSFQKVCLIILTREKDRILGKIVPEEVFQNQKLFIEKFASEITTFLLKFARGQDIIQTLNDNLCQARYEDMNLFLLPDVFLVKNEYYKIILEMASEKLIEKKIIKSNQGAKEYLDYRV
jgi:hypothetical protein